MHKQSWTEFRSVVLDLSLGKFESKRHFHRRVEKGGAGLRQRQARSGFGLCFQRSVYWFFLAVKRGEGTASLII